MASLKWAVALLIVPATPSAAGAIDHWAGHIAEASSRFGVPQGWIRAVMSAESAGQRYLKGRPITSQAGAMGLMQLMPGTWAEMRAAHSLGPNPYDPRDNVLAGTAYLRAMYDRFGYPGLFAAYNAGPARYADHVLLNRRLPANPGLCAEGRDTIDERATRHCFQEGQHAKPFRKSLRSADAI